MPSQPLVIRFCQTSPIVEIVLMLSSTLHSMAIQKSIVAHRDAVS